MSTVTVTQVTGTTGNTYTEASTALTDYITTLISTTVQLFGIGAIMQKAAVGLFAFGYAKKRYTGKWL